MAPRVLILTASVGEGHDLPARMLADGLRRERPDADVVIEDGLAAMGRFVTAVSESAPGVVFFHPALRWVWDLTFVLLVRFAPLRALTQRSLVRIGGPGLLALIEREQPDVVVSVYPHTTEVLGRLRRTGRLHVPAVGVVTDLSAMRYWSARGIDLHEITHPESIPEIRRVAGDETRIEPVRGLTAEAFYEPRGRDEARAAVGVPADGKLVLVSGGGWGVGDIVGAAETALELGDVGHVVCLCGRNDTLLAQVRERFDGNVRVRAVGFTDQMSDWLAAADALIHSTAGLTALEAIMRGCPVISYGWGRGHIRLNNAAFERHGLARVVTSRRDLVDALRRALETRPGPDLSFASLPTAASLVLEYARDGT
ncbi:MAG: MGDG synthase family glycosyltransferase [Gaiellaceae bacterium]